MLTKFEKEILCSEEKRRSVKAQTIRNTTQKIREKAAQAIEDLIFIGNNSPKQLAQALGYTRSGRLRSKTESETKELRTPKIKQVSATLEKRIKRQENARLLAFKLSISTGIMDEYLREDTHETNKVKKPGVIVNLHACNAAFPRFLAGILKNQFTCPKCKHAGILLKSNDDWLFMHFNGDNSNPQANFCNYGKQLPENFKPSPFAVIEPKDYTCWTNLAALGPEDMVTFYS
jgi:hypothetical protein